MDCWALDELEKVTLQIDKLPLQQKTMFLKYMNQHFPPSVFEKHLRFRIEALTNMNKVRNALNNVVQKFPSFIDYTTVKASAKSLENHALIFTAGGEGERLRLSLLKSGYPSEDLDDFTKATFYLPNFYKKYGTLHINLSFVASICKKFKIDIPVIVTTGPEGSITARVIPQILKEYSNFGLKNIQVIEQDERIHFSNDNKVVFQIVNSEPKPITHPDETGGPLMKLKQPAGSSPSILDWLDKLGCERSIVVQATALYDQRLLPLMAEALKGHDCLAVGILRQEFPSSDPFGTFVTLANESTKTMILEQDVRNDVTRQIKDNSGKYYLPFNTGFYAFENDLLRNNNLPHFATPPKELTPDLPRSSKVGYAATDIVPIAKNPVILTINPDMFGVLKTAEDLEKLTVLGKQFGLDSICKE